MAEGMNSALFVRSADAAELDRLATVWFDAWRDAHAHLVPAELTRVRTWESFRSRLEEALRDIRVTGLPGDPSGFCIVKGDELYQLFVAARARGSGVAIALIEDAERRLSKAGVETAWLACAVGNDRAAKFYEKRGWRRAGTMINQAETSDGPFPLEVWRYEKLLGSRKSHFDGRRFFNPSGPRLQPLSAVPRMLLERRTPWPSRVENIPGIVPPLDDRAAAVVTFIGHSTFLVQTAAGNVLTDPMYSEHAGPWNVLGPRRVRLPAIPFDALPQIAIVLVSHNHYDHLDRPTLTKLARKFDPITIAPLANGPLLRSTGLRRVEELDWWDSAGTSPLPITLTPAHHFSARGPFDRNRALWGGFLVEVNHRKIYFAGDSAYTPAFVEVRHRFAPIDLALLPIGAYEPRWFMKAVHMNPAEAVQAHLDLQPRQSIGMHFGTFQLTLEGIDEPRRALDEARRSAGVAPSQFRTLEFGESIAVL
jgi:L-ascorbate metabolism protein UlaG (beta-lactamase superfamily)/GNAT superfamily N-acetyltransferase